MRQQATPYLTFNGNAKEALHFYKEAFNGEILEVKTFGEAEYPTPPELDEKIMHAKFKKDGLFIMVSDAFLNQSIQVGTNISLALELESDEEISTLYNKLSENGTIMMELQDTFWGAKFAKVIDQFDIIWDLNYTKA
jgi:PhnB protein